MTSDTPQDPDVPVTVRTTFQPTVDLQVSVREADSLRRQGLLMPDAEELSVTDGDDEKSGDGQEPSTDQAPDPVPDATPPASPPARKR